MTNWAIPFNNHTGGWTNSFALIFWFKKCSYPLENLKEKSNRPWKFSFFLNQCPWKLLQLYPWNFPMLLGPGIFLFFLITPWKSLIQYPLEKFVHPPVWIKNGIADYLCRKGWYFLKLYTKIKYWKFFIFLLSFGI